MGGLDLLLLCGADLLLMGELEAGGVQVTGELGAFLLKCCTCLGHRLRHRKVALSGAGIQLGLERGDLRIARGKLFAELLLLIGGILLGKQQMMFPRTYGLVSSETRTLPKNTAALEALCQRYPGKVNVMLVPAASAIYPENVPAGAPLLDEDSYLDSLSDAVQAAEGRFVDVRQTLTAHKDEYIYYRTDHHWTSTGAYYAYKQLCDALSLTPFDPSAHTVLTADGFYGTHYSKARTPDAEPDTITYYDLPNALTIYSVSGPGQPADGETTGLYDTAKLDVYDKYAMFLHGNNGLSRIKGDGTGRILVIKDSYANCFVPYLTANYADIDVVDFRNYNYGLDKLIADNDYDQLLVLYSFDSFKSDPYLYRAGVAG